MTERKYNSRLKITRLWLIKVWLVALLLVGCQKGAPEPVAIEREDMCSFCRMAISEKRYAAEFIDNEGQAFKFDDIACMARFTREMRGQGRIAARFVMDFQAKTWLKAEDAYYAQAKEIKTPMSGGIVAFKDESPAKETAGQYGGKVLRFDDVFFGEAAD
jgi:copper chaperone NosL